MSLEGMNLPHYDYYWLWKRDAELMHLQGATGIWVIFPEQNNFTYVF